MGGTDLISCERAIGDQSSFVVSGAIGGFKIASIKYSSFGGGLQYRYYFDEALSGWYGAADVSYQSGKTTFVDTFGDGDDSEFDFSAFGGGVRGGHQWIWDSGFSLDLNLGASYKSFDYDFKDADSTTQGLFKGSGVLPTFGFALGYAW